MRARQLLIILISAAAMGTIAAAQKSRITLPGNILTTKVETAQRDIAAEVTQPTTVYMTNGTLNCKAYSQFSSADNVVGGRELLLDFGGAYTASIDFRDYVSAQGNVDLISATPTNPVGSVQLTTTASSVTSFSTPKNITAVILKDALKTYVFVYDVPGIHYTNDGGNISTNGSAITSVSFCFDQPLNTTAADATISGRVLTKSGRAVGGARITVTNAATGKLFTAFTNPFGYYTIEGLEAGGLYIAHVAKKGVKFEEDSRAISLTDNLAIWTFNGFIN